MSIRIALLLIAAICPVGLASCADSVPDLGDFSIQDEHLDHVRIVREQGGEEVAVVPEYVSAFDVAGRLLLAKQMDVIYFDCKTKEGIVITSVRTDVAHYWVIDLDKRVVSGPISLEGAKSVVVGRKHEWPKQFRYSYRYSPSSAEEASRIRKSCEQTN